MMGRIKEIGHKQGKQTQYAFPSSRNGDKDLDEMPNFILIGDKVFEVGKRGREAENST